MVPLNKKRALAIVLLLALRRRRERKRRFWVHPFNLRRKQRGDFYHLVAELRLDRNRHQEYFRMSVEKMDELLSLVGPELRRQSTSFRAPIEPKQRLAVGLRYLASGDSMVNLACSYRLGHSTVRNSVHMVYSAIEKVMMERFLPKPTEDTWKEVAQGFWEKWNFPNCFGAIDGKHISIQSPPRAGSQNSSHDRTFEILLLALVDADCRFRFIQVADFWRTDDGGMFAGSDLAKSIKSGTLHVPPSAPLPGAAHLGDVPFVMVGDAAFPLKTYLMRPYPEVRLNGKNRIFNYRLSRARKVVENAFAILASRWRIFFRHINLQPQRVETLVAAACILHNFLIDPNENQRILNEAEQLGHRMAAVQNMGGNRSSKAAIGVRETLTTFFNSDEGSVPWQSKMI
ncbi:PREDICTED: putative nuclease HARBI1 [Cyprinodon variegatus]|nr:PREDICTED: putative nuclease HARBI1 [Cyprinodon variegatus]